MSKATSAPIFFVCAAMALVGCASKGPAAPSAAPSAAPEDARPAEMVNAVVLVNGCAELGKANAKAAERTISGLIDACKSVPGGHARVLVTLKPGGRIELAAAEGETATVPLCVLARPLTHALVLRNPCKIDVRLEQSSVRGRVTSPSDD